MDTILKKGDQVTAHHNPGGAGNLSGWFTSGERYTVMKPEDQEGDVQIAYDDEGDTGSWLYKGQWTKVIHGRADVLATAGVKHDADKLRYDLMPPEAVEGLAKVLTFGAQKYGDRNWEKGMGYGRLFGAAMRHMWAWWRGEDNDPETGYSHLAHALSCIAFLLTYVERGGFSQHDDRVHTAGVIDQ